MSVRRGTAKEVDTSGINVGDDRLAKPYPRPNPSGFGPALIKSSFSTFSTRVQICRQISSDILGPGSSESNVFSDEIRYSTMPDVLGKAYSLAIAISCD